MTSLYNVSDALYMHIIIQYSGLEIATDTVANATNIFSLATKNSSLVAKVATRFHVILLCFFIIKNVPNRINKASLPPNLYRLHDIFKSDGSRHTMLGFW